MTRRLRLTAVVAAADAGVVSVATATIPDAGGVIHDCYSVLPPAGLLRVIDTSKVVSYGCNRSVTARGIVSCTWQLPTSAADKRFSGSIAETYKGARISRPFTTHVA
jgi:hypothetical protein